MLKKFIFAIELMASIFFVIWCFDYADAFRGYNSIGGEFFSLCVPLWIVEHEFKTTRKTKKSN